MELRHLRYFVAAAEDLHFGKAAERLNIAQPALSIQIRRLEEELGGSLFHRANRTVTLTEAGRLFLAAARDVLDHAASAEATARRAMQGELASLEIGCSLHAALSGLLGKAVRAIHTALPEVELKLHEAAPLGQIDALMRRRISLAIKSRPGKFGQLDEWIFCLRAATMPRIRRAEHGEAYATEPHTGFQSESGFGGRQGRQDVVRIGTAV